MQVGMSIGVQTLNIKALRIVGRSKDNTSIIQALDILKNSPIKNISIDLIIGLPHTYQGQIIKDLEEIFTHISPQHVSIYILEDELYPESWHKFFPGEEIIRKEYFSGMQWLERKGFHRYELSNFAIPGYESKHNQAYWNHSEYRGFGLSSASYIGKRRFRNSVSFAGYYRGEIVDNEILDSEALKIERIMFGLRTSGVYLADIQKQAILKKFIQDGLIKNYKNKILPTPT
jgi:oxygen-independent coproporphyrinogen-3 oxidase